VGIFRRRRSGPSAPQPSDRPDQVFGRLSVDDVAWIRGLAQRTLGENGVEANVDEAGADLIGSDGMRFALDNVMTTCASVPRSDWPQIVTHHFAAMARTTGAPSVRDLGRDELFQRVRTRLLPVDALHMNGLDLATHSRPVAADLAAVLCVDFPETVSYFDSTVAEGLPIDELFRAGQINTDAEPIEEIGTSDDGVLTFVAGSVYTASKTLSMANLVDRVFGRDMPHGVVFAVPDRNCVLLHPVESIDVLGAISHIAGTAERIFTDAAWSVSPNVYHWYRDTITRISTVDDDRLTIVPTEELVEILGRLAG
jgi:hypothetical protein